VPVRHTVAEATPKYVVMFVLDGAQPAYYDVPGIPHVQALMRKGADFTNGFAGILESETPSGHATIASGSTPAQDGILSFAWANNDNTTVNLFDPAKILDHQMENILQGAPAPDIAGLVHAHNHKATVVALGGHKYYAQDAMGGPEADAIVYYAGTKNGSYAPVAVPGHVPPRSVLTAPGLVSPTTHLAPTVEDHLVMNLVQSTFAHMRPTVMMVNIPEFDWPLGHVDGAGRDPALVRQLMQAFDRDLGRLEDSYRKAGILNQALFVFTSDHGFAPIDHTISSSAIERAVESAGTGITSDTFHTAGYLWINDKSKAAPAALKVAQLQNPYIQSVYFKEQEPNGYSYIRASGPDLFRVAGTEAANQYLLSTFAGPNGPDVVVFFTENSASEPGGQTTWKGDHGGGAWNSQHLRIILSGPGIKPGVSSANPAPLMDIAPTILTLMGVPPTGMQGVPLAEAMAAPTNRQQTTRAAQNRTLGPLIDIMAAESRAEIAAGQ
jgi:hypothetical protein